MSKIKTTRSVDEALNFGPGYILGAVPIKSHFAAYEALQEGGKPYVDTDPTVKERRFWLILARAYSDKGSREFICGPFSDVVSSYAQSTNRTYEEVLLPSQPCRLFIEFRVTLEEYTHETETIIGRIREYVDTHEYRRIMPKVAHRVFSRTFGERWRDVRIVFNVWCHEYEVNKYILDQALQGYDGPAVMRAIDPATKYFVDMPYCGRPGFEPWIPTDPLEPIECSEFLISGQVPPLRTRYWHFNPMPWPDYHPELRPDPRVDIRALSPLVEQYDAARELGFPVTSTANVFTYFLFMSHDPKDPEDMRVIRSDKSHAFVAVVWNKGTETKNSAEVLPRGTAVYPVHKETSGLWRLTYHDRKKDEVHNLEFPASAREFRVVHVIEREHVRKRMREEGTLVE